jgi:Tol biopolymer transport system component
MKTTLLVLLAALPVIPLAAHAAGTGIATPATSASATAGGNSLHPVLAADGRHLAFLSHANNLVTNDDSGEWLDLFVHDLLTGQTELASAGLTGSGGRDEGITHFSISSNGQFIAFSSRAGNLVPGDINGDSDVFVRDLASGITRLVSVDRFGNLAYSQTIGSAAPLSGYPTITEDGRWVYFASRAPNLTTVTNPANAMNIFRRDLWSNTTELVSFNTNPLSSANYGELKAVSRDGNVVAFTSGSGRWTAPTEVHVRDMRSNQAIWAGAIASTFDPSDHRCQAVQLSADGRFLIFVPAWGQVSVLCRYEVASGAASIIATNVSEMPGPQISADGRFVVFEDGTNIYRWDASNGLTQPVSVNMSGYLPPSGVSSNPRLTPDGERVVFVSNAPDMATNATNGAWQILARDMTTGVTRLLSVSTNGGPSTGVDSGTAFAVAGDFSRVAFSTAADNLVAADRNRSADVFVRELVSETTTLVSSAHPARPQLSGSGNAAIGLNCLSDDGRYLAFTSDDPNLVPGDTNGIADVFIRDLVNGTIWFPGFDTNIAASPVISGNGNHLAYLRLTRTDAGMLTERLFCFDRANGTNELLVTAVNTTTSSRPAISCEGRYVARLLGSQLMVFARPGNQGSNQVFSFANTLRMRMRDRFQDAAFTADSKYLLFTSTANHTNNSQNRLCIFVYDLAADRFAFCIPSTNSFSTDAGVAGGLAVSQDSTQLVFLDLLSASPRQGKMYRFSLQTGAREPVGDWDTISDFSLSSNGMRLVSSLDLTRVRDLVTGNPIVATIPRTNATRPMVSLISPDGRFVIYREGTGGANLGMANALHVRDLLLGTTLPMFASNARVSPAYTASSSGTFAFQTVGSGVATGDYNDKSDVFTFQLGVDTDQDGLDDDWEVAYFGNLSRDGNADFDGDGVGDRDEFLAGTEPTNGGSVFRALSVASLGGGSRNVVWTGNPARSYRVEFKDDLNAAAWTALNAAISWNGGNATVTDPAPATNRFYRVVRLP